MLNESNSRRSAAAILLVIMFLSADILVTQTAFEEPILEESDVNQTSTRTESVISQNYISSMATTFNFAADNNTLVGVNATDEARGLINFPNSVSYGSTIQSAILSLFCTNQYSSISSISSYASSLDKSWRVSEATWTNSNSTIFWQTPGADGIDSDRSDWELPAVKSQVSTTGVYNYSFNVTKLVQSDSMDNKTTFDFIISAIGGMLQCAESNNNTAAYHPELFLEISSSAPGDGGSVESNFAVDGMPLMSNDSILSAETNPTLSYTNLNGSNVEFQLSLGEDFRNSSDLDWTYSTLADPFILGTNSGIYKIPQSDSIQNGSMIHYRVRSLDSSGMISNWSNGNFLLPDLDVTDNNDGTATIYMGANGIFDFPNFKLIEDVEVDNSMPNDQLGDSDTIRVQSDLTSESIVHTRINSQYLGLNSSLSIITAEIEYIRTTNPLSSAMLSLHQNNVTWSENEATWNNLDATTNWDYGGLLDAGVASNTILMSGQSSSRFSFAIEDVIQSNSNNVNNGGLEFILLSRLGDESLSSTINGISFGSTENANSALQPRLSITYLLGQSNPVPAPELLTPVSGGPVWNLTGDNISANTIPTMTWNSSLSAPYGMLFQLSEDK